MQAIILANGDFPTHRIPLDAMRQAEFLCCCDGAALSALSHGITPNAIIGDGDSLPDTLKERYADIFYKVDEQEYNDLTKATRFCISRGYEDIVYLGATGKREDHTLGNISLLGFYLREFGIRPLMLTDTGIFRAAAAGTTTFQSFPHQQVSIFNISCQSIKSSKLRWDCYAYRELWQGTLNEALDESFTLQTDGSYIVYQTYEAKQ